MATRGSYVHNSMVEFSGFWGHPENFCFMQFSQKIDGFRQKDSQGFKNSRNSILKQNPLEKFFIFTISQNYTLALMHFTWFSLLYHTMNHINHQQL